LEGFLVSQNLVNLSTQLPNLSFGLLRYHVDILRHLVSMMDSLVRVDDDVVHYLLGAEPHFFGTLADRSEEIIDFERLERTLNFVDWWLIIGTSSKMDCRRPTHPKFLDSVSRSRLEGCGGEFAAALRSFHKV
jgi:hypothetical protein